jgi:hypothetical protein
LGSNKHMHHRSTQKKGHGAKFYCPVTNLKHHLSAILYIDDTDLLHIDLSKDETVKEVHIAIQDSVNSWGNLLIATGGVLQPTKCFYSIILFKWRDGGWMYANNTLRGGFEITVPLPQEGRKRLLITSESPTPKKHW